MILNPDSVKQTLNLTPWKLKTLHDKKKYDKNIERQTTNLEKHLFI